VSSNRKQVTVAKKKTAQASSESSDPKPTFEEALEQLEEIVRELEEGQIGLDEAMARYQQGVELLRQCFDLLERAERKISLLGGVDEEGRPIAQPFDDEALSLDEKATRRSRRRSTPHPPKRADQAPDNGGLDESGGLF